MDNIFLFLSLSAVGVVALYFWQKKGFSIPVGKAGTPGLNSFSQDLTLKAKNGELDPVIGREEEISRVIQILSRKTKNNPLLIGAPGVGKTAIAEGLALRIVTKDVPPHLHDKRVLSLSVEALVAGTKYRGEMEKKVSMLLKELNSSDRKIILFIDEMHTLVQLKGGEGSISPFDLLKPTLAKGNLQILGATTIKEYNEYITIDPTLERRFQPVMVDEPTVKESIEILKGLKKSYEEFHNVKIGDDVIEKAVKFSREYIKDRKLPDKAIDLIDEASAIVKIKNGQNADPAINLLNEAAIKTKKVQNQFVKALKKDLVNLRKKEKQIKGTKNLQKFREKIVEKVKEIEELEAEDKKVQKTPQVKVETIKNIVSKWTGKNIKTIH